MKQVIKKIKANDRLPNVLKELAEVDSDEIERAPQIIDDTEITQAGIWISSKLGVSGIDATLVTGGLLFFFKRATDTDERRQIFENLIDDISVSRSQAYRCIAVWEHFGKLLIDEPALKKYFVVESLKRLAEPGICPMAREAAIAMARRSLRVRIADAEQLIAEFAPAETVTAAVADPEPVSIDKRPRPKQTKKPKSKIWEYAGKFVRFVLEPTDSRVKSKIDHEAIIKDLEAALELYRSEFAKAKAGPSKPTAHSLLAEVSHV